MGGKGRTPSMVVLHQTGKYERFGGYAFKPTPNPTKLQEAPQKLNSMVNKLNSYGGMMINEETGTIFIYLISEEDKKKLERRSIRGKSTLFS